MVLVMDVFTYLNVTFYVQSLVALARLDLVAWFQS